MSANRVLSVVGTASHCQAPSFALLVGLLDATAATLRLAIEQLTAKREATVNWLQRLEAVEVHFQEPRFPDQADPGPLELAKRLHSRGKKLKRERMRVQMPFTAQWPLGMMSPAESLILVDRILFEAQDPEETPEEKSDGEDSVPSDEPVKHFADMVEQLQSRLECPTEENMHVVFLSRVSPENHEATLAAAIEDARRKANELAKCSGCKLGQIVSLSESTPASNSSLHKSWMRQLPFLSDISFGTSEHEQIALGPRAVEFRRWVAVSFSITPD